MEPRSWKRYLNERAWPLCDNELKNKQSRYLFIILNAKKHFNLDLCYVMWCKVDSNELKWTVYCCIHLVVLFSNHKSYLTISLWLKSSHPVNLIELSQDSLWNCSKNDLIVMLGDWNAKVRCSLNMAKYNWKFLYW